VGTHRFTTYSRYILEHFSNELTGVQASLEELHNLYTKYYQGDEINENWMEAVPHGRNEKCIQILIETPEEKKPVRKCMHR
jgi:hypothetical protein